LTRCQIALALAFGSWGCADKTHGQHDTSHVAQQSIQISHVTGTDSVSTVRRAPIDSDDEPKVPSCAAVDPSIADSSDSQNSVVRVRLVDSAWAGEPGDIGILLFRVEVQSAASRDTVPLVRVATLPGVSSAGKVHLIGYNGDGNLPDDARVYDPRTRALTVCHLPLEIEVRSQYASISPDARHVAYISEDNAVSQNFGVVRKWSDTTLVVKTAPEPSHTSDEVDYNGARWLDANHAEFVYRSGRAKSLWIHATVSVADRKVTLDSLSSRPGWAR